METRDVVILGAGPSGLYAAAYAGMRRLSALVVEAGAEPGGQPRHLYGHKHVLDFPAVLNATGETLAEALIKQARSVGGRVDIVCGRKLTGWERLPDGKLKSFFDDGSQCLSNAIVIAVGSGSLEPIELDTEIFATGTDLSKFCYRVKSFSEYAKKRLVILGGGDAAVEWAAQLAEPNNGADCASIAIVHRRDAYRANAKYVEQMRSLGVVEHLGCKLVRIEPSVLVVNAPDGGERQIPYDEVIVQYGLRQVKNVGQE